MIRIRQIKIPIEKDNMLNIRKKIYQKLNCLDKDLLNIKISKKSLDARNKPNLFYIYEVDIEINNEDKILKKKYQI